MLITITGDDEPVIHTLNDITIARLMPLVAADSAAEGVVMTVARWIAWQAETAAVAAQLAPAVADLQKQQQADAQAQLEAAIKTARAELIATLKKDDAPKE